MGQAASRWTHIVLLGALGVSWGAHVGLAKLLDAQNAVEALAYLTLYMLATAAILLGVAFAAPPRNGASRFRPSLKVLIFFGVAGLFSYFIPLLGELVAAPQIDATLFSLIEAFGPAMSASLAVLFAVERVTERKLVAILLIVLAGLMLTAPGANLPTGERAIWLLVAAMAPLSYAITDLYILTHWPIDAAGKRMGVLPLSAGEALFGFFLSLAVAVAYGVDAEMLLWAAGSWPLLLALTLANVTTALLAIYLLKAESAVFVSFAGILALFVGVAAGIALFDESPSPAFWSSAALVVAALWFLRIDVEPERPCAEKPVVRPRAKA